MNQKLQEAKRAARHKAQYIYWDNEAKRVYITLDEFKSKVEWLKENGHWVDIKARQGQKTLRRAWAYPNSYVVDDAGSQLTLYINENNELKRYWAYKDSEKEGRKTSGSGSESYKLVNKLLKQFYGEVAGTMAKAYGSFGKDFTLNKCVSAMRQLIIVKPENRWKRFTGCYKADISSAFPAQAIDLLPDQHTAIYECGRIEPNEEYPVCFYIKSGHIAEYGKYDTRDFLKCEYFNSSRMDLTVKDEDEVTCRMKYSKYSLAPIMNKLYEEKCAGDPNAKTFLVAFFGYLRSVESWHYDYMGHISGVVYARHINHMIEITNELIAEGNKPLLFATDSIIWKGKESKLTTKEKKLGAFVSEYENVMCAIVACGVYALQKDDKLYVVKHQGTKGDDIKKAGIKNISDFLKYHEKNSLTVEKWNENSQEFETLEVLNIC